MWCDDQTAYDFPNEPFYQMRAIISAIGFWQAEIWDKPASLDLGRVVARSTYLWRLNEVSPHIQPSGGIHFLICPLGWTAFLHTFFAGFEQWRVSRDLGGCEPEWLGIAANLIASTVPGTDFSMVAMVNAIIGRVHEFAGARHGIKNVLKTPLSRDLVYGTEEFALCHEIAHVAAQDFCQPDESRADRWALASFVHSWELRPALYIEIASFDPIREVIGPFAFFAALRSLLAARAIVAKRLELPDSEHATRVWRQFADRSLESRQLLRDWLDASVTEKNIDRFKTDLPVLESLVDQLTLRNGIRWTAGRMSPGACAAARQVAEETGRNEPDGLEP